MKFPNIAFAATLAALAGALSGCVVAPAVVRPAYPGPVVYEAPPGVIYVAPTYALPAPGYAWQYHGRYGWGWRHSAHGWHRGWR